MCISLVGKVERNIGPGFSLFHGDFLFWLAVFTIHTVGETLGKDAKD